MIQKIVVVGNAGSGKTTLSRYLAKIHGLPLTHVDSIQFLPGMKIRPHQESIQMLTEIENKDQWIIEGYGPFDIIERRFQAADRIVFLDPPLWRLYWWCTKRQIKNAWSKREELPEGCNEFSIAQTLKLYRTVKTLHEKMRPELLKIFNRENLRGKMVWVRKMGEWEEIRKNGLS
jgi:adenylate kinase family enzyme